MAAIYSNGGNRWNILGFNFAKRDALSTRQKRRARCSTGLNNVLLPTLFTLVNNIEQYC
jgi:hypothetical protein